MGDGKFFCFMKSVFLSLPLTMDFISELLVKYTSPNDVTIQKEVLKKVSIYCKKPVTNHTLDAYVDPHVWSFYHSVFFSFTVCSTLGRSSNVLNVSSD